MNIGQAGGASRNVQGFEAVDSALEAVVIIIGFFASDFGHVDDEIVAAGCPDGACVSG